MCAKAMSSNKDTSVQKVGFRILQIPEEVAPDEDAFVNSQDFKEAVDFLQETRKAAKNAKRLVFGLGLGVLLLAGTTFATASVAIRESRDVEVDNHGVLHAKRSGAVVQTRQALALAPEGLTLLNMSNRELADLREMVMMGGRVHFNVKGSARSPAGDRVVLLVEGGTLTIDDFGIADATGDARSLLLAAGFDENDLGRTEEDAMRMLTGDTPTVSPTIKGPNLNSFSLLLWLEGYCNGCGNDWGLYDQVVP